MWLELCEAVLQSLQTADADADMMEKTSRSGDVTYLVVVKPSVMSCGGQNWLMFLSACFLKTETSKEERGRCFLILGCLLTDQDILVRKPRKKLNVAKNVAFNEFFVYA